MLRFIELVTCLISKSNHRLAKERQIKMFISDQLHTPIYQRCQPEVQGAGDTQREPFSAWRKAHWSKILNWVLSIGNEETSRGCHPRMKNKHWESGNNKTNQRAGKPFLPHPRTSCPDWEDKDSETTASLSPCEPTVKSSPHIHTEEQTLPSCPATLYTSHDIHLCKMNKM